MSHAGTPSPDAQAAAHDRGHRLRADRGRRLRAAHRRHPDRLRADAAGSRDDGRVTVQLMRQDHRAVLEVQDSAIGISQPDGHEGNISAQSLDGHGMTFRIELPLHRTAEVTA
jgi:signal transduction histidine kinase